MTAAATMQWTLELYPLRTTTFADLDRALDEVGEMAPSDARVEIGGTCLRFKWTEYEETEEEPAA